jgi:protein gp37
VSDKSKIEWTDATWNPVTGCTKVSAGCKFCYAERDFADVRTHPDRLEQPIHWTRPRRIFVNSMSDLFHESVPFEFVDKVWLSMIKSQKHTFQILTKRPQGMADFFKWENSRCEHPTLPNVWLGVSVEDQKTADDRIPMLLQTPAAVRFVSYEPALGPVELRCIHHNREFEVDALTGNHGGYRPLAGRGPKLDWVIAGGESGPNARPSHPDWFPSVRDQCQAAGVPFFFKQWGEWAEIPAAGGTGKLLPKGSHFWMNGDGTEMNSRNYEKSSARMGRIGKKRAGRLLDGREWNEYPGVAR